MRYFITRHIGALEWAAHTGFAFDVHQAHLDDIERYQYGDIVAGTLPINLVADLLQQGVIYLHLSLIIPPQLRGVELSAQQLFECEARLEEFTVMRTFFYCSD